MRANIDDPVSTLQYFSENGADKVISDFQYLKLTGEILEINWIGS